MPFTPSHAAAVLPLLGTPLPASALVTGAVVPDLPFYLPVGDVPALGVATHQPLAVVTVDVVLGLAAYALWHAVLARPALAAAPPGVRARLEGRVPVGLGPRLRSLRGLLLVCAAIAVGAATHVVWDAFTHDRRWGTDLIPVLAGEWAGRPRTRWAQDVSTVLGALLLAGWLVRWLRRTTPRAVAPEPAWWVPWAVLAGVGTGVGLAYAVEAGDPRSALFLGVVHGGAAAALTAAVLALGWHARRAVRR